MSAVLPHVRGRLLDIGCGTNKLVRAYIAAGGEGLGVDVHPWEGCDLVVTDTAHLPYADEEFTTVTIIAALNHIPNRFEVLQEAHRLLRPGGGLLLTMLSPAISTVWHTLRKPWDADQKVRGMKEGEVYGLTRRRVHELLVGARFEVVEVSRFMMGLNHLTVARKLCTRSATSVPNAAQTATA